jgi:predicted RNA binding protein YcfA (HicA-like mRNA interferase family)
VSRLPTLTPRKVLQALQRGNFQIVAIEGAHHSLRHPITGCTTMVSLHPGDLSRKIMGMILEQAGLSEEEFRELL